ncbi:unnamed protein product [Didymodactylos carnosus]|uniref:Mitoferrin-1 n=1 Tax=Didymodactylos carnosus TaxID=1234261 RepID=A0A814PZT4_9BILA|nr:unnamed protein product [Didymodactylos carnosus]CAF1214051.1 unnamed protein product [Didymodactylos carnosus]CAF3877031.1 unnamed protein product [Didymodactylos carnosus]CAF4022775.1 unnamed protein product [Didymodactylos carnosus]
MASHDDYESLPETMHPTVHAAAGALAGIGEHCIMYPIDVVKVRGMHIVAIAAGPAHALYFSCYERMKILFSGTLQAGHDPIANGLAGCCATLFHDAIMVPADDCLRKMIRSEGLSALYRSYTTQLTMNIPFHSIHLITYELLQDMLNYDRMYDPLSHVISGGAAGAVASAFTTPLDVCKTLLNVQECCLPEQPCSTATLTSTNIKSSPVNGLFTAIRVIYTSGGILAFFKGLTPRVLYQIPSTAVAWSVYEFFKHFLSATKTENTSSLTVDDQTKLSTKLTDTRHSNISSHHHHTPPQHHPIIQLLSTSQTHVPK